MSPPRKSRFPKRRHRPQRRPLLLIIATILLETVSLWLRAHRLGANIIVRCRQGHLFATIWIPAASVKSLRLGWSRVQYCPVGRHWTVVTPVNQAELSDDERRAATERHDIRIP